MSNNSDTDMYMFVYTLQRRIRNGSGPVCWSDKDRHLPHKTFEGAPVGDRRDSSDSVSARAAGRSLVIGAWQDWELRRDMISHLSVGIVECAWWIVLRRPSLPTCLFRVTLCGIAAQLRREGAPSCQRQRWSLDNGRTVFSLNASTVGVPPEVVGMDVRD